MYDASQQHIIARQLARNGRNVAKAQAALRDGYESFRRVSLNTLRRLLRNKKFDRTVETEYVLWLEAERRGVAAATEEQARRAQEGTIIQKIGRLETLFDDALEDVQKLIKEAKTDSISFSEKLRLLGMVAKIIDRRKDRVLPVIAESREAAFYIEAMYEVLVSKVGPARTKEIVTAIGPLYEEKRKASEAKHATAQVAEEAT